MRREGPSSRSSLPPSSDSTACMPGCRHDRAPSRGQSRKPVRPSGMTKPSAWRAFLRPAAYRTFWNAPRMAKGQPHGSETSSLPDGGPGQTLLKVRHGIRLPAGASPSRSITDRMSDKMASRSLRPEIATKRAGCRAAPGQIPCFLPRRPLPGTPTLPSLPVSPKRPSSARIASRPAACHASSLIKAYARRDPPLHRRKALPVFPELFQRPGSKHEREREKENTPPPFTPQHPPPLRSYVMPYFKQPPDSDGDFRPDLKKVFSGMGRAREGKGQFLQKTPLPLSSFPRSTAPPQQKSGAVTCTRFYRKNKGTIVCYFFSPLCLRLWPCCMK